MTERSSCLNTIIDQISPATDAKSRIELIEQALQLTIRKDNPQLWASLQGMLGASLVEAISGRLDEDLIKKILAAYEAALSVYDPELTPGTWLATLRNLGATHVLAFRDGVGDVREHVEAAIAAYEKVLSTDLRDEDTLPIWLQSQREITQMLRASVPWRGSEALLRAARACEEALQVVGRDKSPKLWAALSLDLGRCLFEVGDKSDKTAERSICACQDALRVLRVETDPIAWAIANLVLGGVYRTRRVGDRDQNLERATEYLERSLSVLAPETTPHEWYCAHYQRGPAYAYCAHGDRQQNQEKALESLEIAICGMSREQFPEAWASLQIALGDVCRQRIAGDPTDNSNRAVMAFESARNVLTLNHQSDLWIRANNSLGHAYLERRSIGVTDDVERAISILEEAQASPAAQKNVHEWCATYINLAMAYLWRTTGNAEQNRTRAIECLERTLTLPLESWRDPEEWMSCQSLRALFLLCPDSFPVARTFPDITQTEDLLITKPTDAVSAQVRRDNKRSDVFNLADMAREQINSLRNDIAAGKLANDIDPDWHVPYMLNEDAYLMGIEFQRFLEKKNVWRRTREERTKLERARFQLFRSIVEHLVEKYDTAQRTQSLFRGVEEGRKGFVLFLRGFAYRAHYLTGITIVSASGSDLSEKTNKIRFARLLAPVPLVWIANPIESGPFSAVEEHIYDNYTKEARPDLRIEMGSNWEADIRNLISAASFIIVFNQSMTEGVVTEIMLIEELGRRKDTLFHAPDQAAVTLGVDLEDCSPLTDAAVERMKVLTVDRPLRIRDLPAPTCLWVDGPRRAQLEFEITALRSWLNHVVGNATSFALDMVVDTNMSILAKTLLLERLDLIPSTLLAISEALRSLGEDHLEGAELLADGYASYTKELRCALAQCPADLTLVERTMFVLQEILGTQTN